MFTLDVTSDLKRYQSVDIALANTLRVYVEVSLNVKADFLVDGRALNLMFRLNSKLLK